MVSLIRRKRFGITFTIVRNRTWSDVPNKMHTNQETLESVRAYQWNVQRRVRFAVTQKRCKSNEWKRLRHTSNFPSNGFIEIISAFGVDDQRYRRTVSLSPCVCVDKTLGRNVAAAAAVIRLHSMTARAHRSEIALCSHRAVGPTSSDNGTVVASSA